VTFIHPSDEDSPSPPPSSAASPQTEPVQVPVGLPTTPRRRPLTAPATPIPTNNTNNTPSIQPLQVRQLSQPSKAQQLYASAANVTSLPSISSEDAQRSLYQPSTEFDPISLYGSPVSLSPTSPASSSPSSAPLSPNRPPFFQESYSKPQRRVGHSASFSASFSTDYSTGTHTRDDSTTSEFRTRALFQAAPSREPPIDPTIRRNMTESALITMPHYNSGTADTFSKPGGLPVYGQPPAPNAAIPLSPASSSSSPPPLTSPGAPMASSAALNSQNFYMHGVSAPGPVFVVPRGTAMPHLPGLASAPVPGQPHQMSLPTTGGPLRHQTLPNLPSQSPHLSGSISPQQMVAQPAQPQSQGPSLPPGAAAPQMVPSLLPLTMATPQAPMVPTQQYYFPNGQMVSAPTVGSPPFQGAATMQMQGVPQQQFAPNPQQQQQDEAKRKQQKILKKVGISLGKTVLKVGAKAALGGIGVDQGMFCISYARD